MFLVFLICFQSFKMKELFFIVFITVSTNYIESSSRPLFDHDHQLSMMPSVLIPWHAAGLGSLHRFDCRTGSSTGEFQGIQGQVHSARWFKDNQEFYRFQQNQLEKNTIFNVPGINVDIDESGISVVALFDVDQATSGVYKCQLMTDDQTVALTHEFGLTVENPDESLFRELTVRQRVPIRLPPQSLGSPVAFFATSGTNTSTIGGDTNLTASLNCFVDERPGKIYSYKWFKDGNEFYRFVPWNETEPEMVFPVDGVTVDLGNSNGTDVNLVDVGTNTTGLFKCVASTATSPNRTLVHRIILEFSVPETAATQRQL